MVLLAFSLQHQVEKYGAYVGIASFFGLAALSLLYFAQAREVRRLREWAGRAPERAQELEERVVAQAEAVRRVTPPVAAPVTVVAEPATNGARKLKPEEVAALAFARAAGVAEPPHPPKPAPAPQPVAAVAAPTATAAPVEAPPAPEATVVEEAPPATNGHGSGDVPPPATSAARRPAAQAPAAPLRATPPPRPAPPPARRAPAGPPPRRETSTRSVVFTAVFGVILLVAVVFAGVKLLGGGGGGGGGQAGTTPNTPVVTPPASKGSKSGAKSTATPAAPARGTTTVAVLNGTQETGLAATTRDRLLTGGYAKDNVNAGNNPPTDRQRATSVVMYKTGARAQARDVARILDIKDVQPLDPATQAATSVVVVVGADKSGN